MRAIGVYFSCHEVFLSGFAIRPFITSCRGFPWMCVYNWYWHFFLSYMEFTSEAIWAWSFLFGKGLQSLDKYFFLLVWPNGKEKSGSTSLFTYFSVCFFLLKCSWFTMFVNIFDFLAQPLEIWLLSPLLFCLLPSFLQHIYWAPSIIEALF